ncbi:MAG TPA: redox-sensing transcriptional repressor Rex [Bacteroidetes bacterium]|nr:redox-sensing transcriptional repressor Rex [Bacteroidota bacterium]
MENNRYKNIPHKTIERLSQYRRALQIAAEKGKTNIFSHEIAALLHITAVQVRRDLMLIGYSGSLRKGYDINDLIHLIGELIDSPKGQKVAIFGMGDLGRAIINYFQGKREKLQITVGFDINPEKTNRKIAGIPCYHLEKITEIISNEGIKIGILTVPGDQADETVRLMVEAGIKGILNYTPTPVEVPDDVYLEEYNMISSLEKVAFYVKEKG